MWNPWATLATEHPDVEVIHTTSLPSGVLGATDGATIWLATDQTQAERRCTLTHELVHVELHHDGCQPPRVEADVEWEAARRLIEIDHLATTMAWAHSEAEAAEDLWVDTTTLRTRLTRLTARERALVDAVLRGGRVW